VDNLLRRLINLLTTDLHFSFFGLMRMASAIFLGIALTTESRANSQDACTDFWKYACQNRQVSAKADDWVGESDRLSPYVFGGRAHRIYQKAFSENLSTSAFYPRWLKFKKAMGAPFTEDVVQTVKNYEALYLKMGPLSLLKKLDQQLATTDGDSIEAGEYLSMDTWKNTLIRDVESLLDSKKQEPRHPVHRMFRRYLEETVKTELPPAREAIEELRLYCSLFPDALCRKQFINFLKDWHQGYFEPVHKELSGRREFRAAIMDRVFPNERRQQFQMIFSDLKIIAREMFAGRLTEAELERLNKTQLAWSDESESVTFQTIAYGQNGFYDSAHTKNIVILGGYSDMSEYDVWRVIAHEYGHALDLGEIGPNMTKVTNHLRTCLQRPTSVNALQKQLKEAVADWIGFELLARYYSKRLSPVWQLAALQKSTLQLGILTCAVPQQSIQNPLLGMDQVTIHPPWNERANRIFMAHPYFRSLFGCSKNEEAPEYCDMP
jgi:hypothetical protein